MDIEKISDTSLNTDKIPNMKQDSSSMLIKLRYRSSKVISDLQAEINKLKKEKNSLTVQLYQVQRRQKIKKSIEDTTEKKVDQVIKDIKMDKIENVRKNLLFSETVNRGVFEKYKRLKKPKWIVQPSGKRSIRFIFYMLTKLKEQIHCLNLVTWNYQESGHGKGAPDGIGAVVKRTADNHVRLGGDVATFGNFVQVVQKNIKNIELIIIPEESISRKIFPKNIPSFKGYNPKFIKLFGHRLYPSTLC
ncbi:hypothetical protein ACJJTC_013991 [Scirpophaga incertulas]